MPMALAAPGPCEKGPFITWYKRSAARSGRAEYMTGAHADRACGCVCRQTMQGLPHGALIRETSMADGLTIMSPWWLMSARWPARLYSIRNLGALATASCRSCSLSLRLCILSTTSTVSHKLALFNGSPHWKHF